MPEIVVPGCPSPLKAAIGAIGGPDVIRNSKDLELVICKMPKKDTPEWKRMEGVFVTGLQGKVASDTTLHLPDGQQARLKKGDSWIIRWDYDPSKLSHVNAAFGKNGYRFAFQASPSHLGHGSQPYFDAIINQSRSINYHAPTGKATGLFGGSKKEKNMELAAKELADQWGTWYYAPRSNYPTMMSATNPGFNPRR